MNEFLTDNVRLAYPLEREMPSGVGKLWQRLLSDACVATDAELSGVARLSLLSVRRDGPDGLTLYVGTEGIPSLAVEIQRGLGGFAVVYASSGHVKALLTVNGKVADEIMSDDGYGTDEVQVNVPFALRCAWDAHRRVTSVSAYSAEPCTTPAFTGDEEPVVTVSGGDVTIAAKDGIDAEATRLMPLDGTILRLSAIAAPADSAETDTDVDIMIRGDACFTVETIPGAKVVGGDVVPRTEDEPDGLGVLGGGVVRIGNACKPCCRCDDYRDAVDALRDPESLAVAIEQVLNDAKANYDAAVAEFDRFKTDAMASINDPGNVSCKAVASLSQPAYINSRASGKRARMSITLSVANMTQVTASISGISFNVPQESGFSVTGVSWTVSSGGETSSGSSTTVEGTPAAPPAYVSLEPGGTAVVVATYSKTSTSNEATRPDGMSASVAISSGGVTDNRTVEVS